MPIDVLAAMQGTDGLGKGLTTYPDSVDADELQAHDDCVALEATGQVVRHAEGVRHAPGALESEGQRFVIWMPVDVPPPAP